MLDLRLSVFPNADDIMWYANIGELRFHEYLDDSLMFETPCNLESLLKSSNEEGLHCLFSCSCGDPGCSSIWVEVTHKASSIRWGKSYRNNNTDGGAGDFIGNAKLDFDVDHYRDTINKAILVTKETSPIILRS